MKKSPYLKINRLEFMVTYNCTGRCRHCSVGDMLGKTGGHRCVQPDKAAEAVRFLGENYDMASVMTFGGEPMLYPDAVFAIHSAARECGVPSRQLFTNGYFTNSRDKMCEAAYSLVKSGVNNVLLSIDAFHQEKIPEEKARIFAEFLRDAGMPNFRLHPAWLVNAAHENAYNRETRAILSRFAHLGIPVSSGNDIFMAGNAAKYLAEYYPPPKLDLSQRCGSMPYTEPLTSITSLSIEPNGDVVACAFVIGNIYKESMAEITARYNPFENPYMRALIEGGAPALIKAAAVNGVTAGCSDCYSVCDLCRKICR